MTSQDQDTERKWAPPRYEVAKALADGSLWPGAFDKMKHPEPYGGATAEREVWLARADTAISVLLRHGWVNPQFMDALKAEKAEASTPGKPRNT